MKNTASEQPNLSKIKNKHKGMFFQLVLFRFYHWMFVRHAIDNFVSLLFELYDTAPAHFLS